MCRYICAIPKNLSENYEIGLRSCIWGVEERYNSKINPVRQGAKLVFVVGGIFRFIHTVDSEPFKDMTLLWPPIKSR